MKCSSLIIIFFIIFNSKAFGQQDTSDQWRKHISIVNNEIKSIESLGSRDDQLNLKLFEIYGEKLSLLIEEENRILLNIVDPKNNKTYITILSVKKECLNRQTAIGDLLLKNIQDNNLKGRVLFYKALSYELFKKSDLFEANLVLAKEIVDDKNLLSKIDNKLADYYYNNMNFQAAIPLYETIIKDKKDRWLAQHFYNLAWCYFKQNYIQKALFAIDQSYLLSGKMNYFKIKENIVDSMLLFLANAGEVNKGIDILNKEEMIQRSKLLLKFIDYTSSFGKEQDLLLLFNYLEHNHGSMDPLEVLKLKLKVLYEKKYNLNAGEELSHFKEKFKGQTFNSNKEFSEIVDLVMEKVGFYQEVIKDSLIKEQHKKEIMDTIKISIHFLLFFDPVQSLKYHYFLGETFFSDKQYTLAVNEYLKGIQLYHKSKSLIKSDFLKKVYDSLFRSLEISKNTKPNVLVYIYSNFLQDLPSSPIRQNVIERLLLLYESNTDYEKVLKLIPLYLTQETSNNFVIKDLVKRMINHFSKELNIERVIDIKVLLDKNFVYFTADEIAKIDAMISGLQIVKAKKAIEENKKIGRKEILALLKKNLPRHINEQAYLLLLNSYDIDKEIKEYIFSTTSFLNFLELKMSEPSLKLLNLSLLNICNKSVYSDCIRTTNLAKSKRFVLNSELNDLIFKLDVINSNWDSTIPSINENKWKEDFFFQFLGALPLEERLKIYGRHWKKYFQNVQRFEAIINNDLLTYLKEVGLDYKFSSDLIDLNECLVKINNDFSLSSGLELIGLTRIPETEIDFNFFQNYLSSLDDNLKVYFDQISLLVSRGNLTTILWNIDRIEIDLANSILYFQTVLPKTADPQLTEAIIKELRPIAALLDKKSKEVESHKSKIYFALSPSHSSLIRTVLKQPVQSLKGSLVWPN